MQDPNRLAGFEPTNSFYDEPEYMEDTDTGSLFDENPFSDQDDACAMAKDNV